MELIFNFPSVMTLSTDELFPVKLNVASILLATVSQTVTVNVPEVE